MFVVKATLATAVACGVMDAALGFMTPMPVGSAARLAGPRMHSPAVRRAAPVGLSGLRATASATNIGEADLYGDLTNVQLSGLNGKALKEKPFPNKKEVFSVMPADTWTRDTKVNPTFICHVVFFGAWGPQGFVNPLLIPVTDDRLRVRFSRVFHPRWRKINLAHAGCDLPAVCSRTVCTGAILTMFHTDLPHVRCDLHGAHPRRRRSRLGLHPLEIGDASSLVHPPSCLCTCAVRQDSALHFGLSCHDRS